MTTEKIYRCDLCRASVGPELLDKALFGIIWRDLPHGWDRQNSDVARNHICKTCLISLRRIANEVFQEKK